MDMQTDDSSVDLWLPYVEYILGGLSLLGTGLITLIFFKNLKTLTAALELIFYLSLSTILNTLSYIINYIPDTEIENANTFTCQFQGWLMLTSEMSLFMITTLMLVFIFKTVSMPSREDKLDWSTKLIFIGVSFGLTSFVSTIGLYFDIFGPNGKWCWIKQDYVYTLGVIIYIYVWALSVIDIILAACILKWEPVFEPVHSEEVQNRKSYANRMLMYPIIFLLCWVPATINRSYFLLYDYKNFVLEDLSLIFMMSQGLLFSIFSANTLGYARFLKTVWYKIKCCCCCKKKRADLESNSDLLDFLYNNSGNQIDLNLTSASK